MESRGKKELYDKRITLLKWLQSGGRPVSRAAIRNHHNWTHQELARVVTHSIWFITSGALITVSDYGIDALKEPEPRWVTVSGDNKRSKRKRQQHEDMSVLQGIDRPKADTHKMTPAERERRIEQHRERVARGL